MTASRDDQLRVFLEVVRRGQLLEVPRTVDRCMRPSSISIFEDFLPVWTRKRRSSLVL